MWLNIERGMFRRAWIIGAGINDAMSKSPSRDICDAMALTKELGQTSYAAAIESQQASERSGFSEINMGEMNFGGDGNGGFGSYGSSDADNSGFNFE